MLIFLGCGIGIAPEVKAQILDDTTVQKYGTRTTRFRYLQDVFDNRDTLHRIDTVLRNFQNNDDYVLRDKWPAQDLGNLGTAQKPIFPQATQPIGAQFGFNAFDRFAYDVFKTRFYNTFSPHTWVDYAQGPEERQSFEAGFSRNINARSNVGLEYRTIGSNKFFGRVRPEDPSVQSQALRLSASYVSPKGQFISLASYTYNAHKQFETGGVLPSVRDSTREANPQDRKLEQDSLLLIEIQRPQLPDASVSYQDRNTILWYNQLSLDAKGQFQLWYQAHHEWQRQGFETGAPTTAPYFRDSLVWANRFGTDSMGNRVLLPKVNYNPGYTNDETRYLSSTHTFGVKGGTTDVRFGAHARYRYLQYSGNRFGYTGPTSELYVGGYALWRYNAARELRAEGQTILGRDVELKGVLRWDNLRAEASISRYSPTLFQQRYFGNHFSWENDFDLSTRQHLMAEYSLPWQKLGLTIGAELMQWQKMVYMNSRATPEQASGGNGLTSIWLNTNFRFWRIRTEQQIRYSLTNGSDLVRVPALWVHWKTYFEYRPERARNIEVNVGLDMRYRSTYNGDYYMAVTQQFYLQPTFGAETPAAQQRVFPLMAAIVVDPYFTMRVNRTLVFVKVNNALQGIGSNGYFSTPFYPGLARNFQLGIKWYFFD